MSVPSPKTFVGCHFENQVVILRSELKATQSRDSQPVCHFLTQNLKQPLEKGCHLLKMLPTISAQRNAKLNAIMTGSILALAGSLVFFFTHTLFTILLGLGLVIGLFFYGYQRGMRNIRRRLSILATPFPENWHDTLVEDVGFYRDLNQPDQQRFQQLIRIFLAETRITGVGTQLDDQIRLLVGAAAVIPILGWPDFEYRYLSEVLIYPHQFNQTYQTGNSENHSILGMVHGALNNGVMILSLRSLKQGFKNSVDKQNVGIHEFVHMIDKNDGVIDGLPSQLPADIAAPWKAIVEDLLSRGRKFPRDINRYGMTNPQEFLAVITEYFFENPSSLQKRHPEIYQLIRDIYKQDLLPTPRLLKPRIKKNKH